MKGGIGKGGLSGKLALGFLAVSFMMAVTNFLILPSFVIVHDEGFVAIAVRTTSKAADPNHPKAGDKKAETNPHKAPHDMTQLLQDQREKAKQAAASNQLGKTNSRPKRPDSHKSRDDAIYTCTYGATKTNRTKVVAPKHEPSFIIIGVQKAGSTALLSHFRDHPQVLQTKRKARREAHFFDSSWNSQVMNIARAMGMTQANDKRCLALEQYMKIFETETILANSQTMAHEVDSSSATTTNATHHLPLYTFEKTPSYFYNPKVPARIKQTVPWSKLILVLRNPTDRFYSQYKMTVQNDYDTRKYSIEDFLYYEIKAMKELFHMTTAPLMVPVNVTEGENATDPSIPTLAHHYTFPEAGVPFDHPIFKPEEWTPKHRAIWKKPDEGKFGNQNGIRRGLYSTQLKWWMKHYTINEDLLVINYADLVNNVQEVYERVCHFVGIPLPYGEHQDPLEVGINFTGWVRTDNDKNERPLSETTRKYLNEFYAPYTAELEGLLGPEWSSQKLGWN